MPLHKSVTPRSCPSKISDAMCKHPSSRFKNDQFCRQKFRCFCGLLSRSSHWLVGQAILQNAYEKCFYSSLTSFNLSSCFHRSCTIFSVGGGTKCFSVILLPCSFTYFITFSLKPAVYGILICLLHIPRTNLLSINSLSLCTSEQLEHGTMQPFLSFQG